MVKPWNFVGHLVRFENGILTGTHSHEPIRSDPSFPVVLYSDYKALLKVVTDHNDGHQKQCGVGENEATKCGYRSYFLFNGRRCPQCPVHDLIEIPQ